MNFLLYASLALPLLAIVGLLLSYAKPTWQNAVHVTATSAWLALSVLGLFHLHDLSLAVNLANWPSPFGIELSLDAFTLIMLFVFALTCWCISLFSLNDEKLAGNKTGFYLGFWLLVFGIVGALTTRDIFNFYVWSELMLVSAFIILSATNQKNTKALTHYAVLNIFGTLIILLSIALIYGLTGTLNYDHLASYGHGSLEAPLRLFILLLLIGWGVKAAIFPLYFWLPRAYPNTASSSVMLLASLVTKTMMVVLIRWLILWPFVNTGFVHMVLVIAACLTMFLGVMGAASQFRVHHILSFHIVSQLGYILLACAFSGIWAVIAAVFFIIHNVWVKTSLFMIGGIVEKHYPNLHLKALPALLKKNKALATAFFFASMSLAGFPPLSGFWAKLLVIQTTLTHHAYVAAGVAILVSLFTLYSMIKIWRLGFCQGADDSAKGSLPISPLSWLALLPLIVLPIVIGLHPDSILMPLQQALYPLSPLPVGGA